ncbi:hypothetical protein ABW21_db0202628 [Orbilia brochopaga]|nr:hypothetical protein ABW21_db0202628 [Drechslerella brochopaga]
MNPHLLLSLVVIFGYIATMPLDPDRADSTDSSYIQQIGAASESDEHITKNPFLILKNNRTVPKSSARDPTRTYSTISHVKRTGQSEPVLGQVPWTFFLWSHHYKKEFRQGYPVVKCLSPQFVYDLTPVNYGLVTIEFDWPIWSAAPREQAYPVIATHQRGVCRKCDCDENGKIILPTGRGKLRNCPSQLVIDRCVIIYACTCQGRLWQPKTTATHIPIEEYQKAIDNIPETVKSANPDWSWDMDGLPHEPGQRMRWSKNRQQVHDPGIKEPYYIEGPSDGPTWDWLRTLNGGGLGLGLLKGSIRKREQSSPRLEPIKKKASPDRSNANATPAMFTSAQEVCPSDT